MVWLQLADWINGFYFMILNKINTKIGVLIMILNYHQLWDLRNIWTYWYWESSSSSMSRPQKWTLKYFGSTQYFYDTWNWTELCEPIIIIVLAKWFLSLSDFFIASRPLHTRTMGLKGTNIWKLIVIFFLAKHQFYVKIKSID